MNKNIAFGLIDAQRGFMPAEEGERLGLPGFGELGVPNGERIVPKVNALLAQAALNNLVTFTTQDWHPENTAHFSAEPNFNTTWPAHCVAETPGAELNPEIVLPRGTKRIIKGTEVLLNGEDDTSYSGLNGQDPETGQTTKEFLEENNVKIVILGGLALDYCVKETALDFKKKLGLQVAVVTDATQPVAQETGLAAIDELEKAGVKLITTDQALKYMEAA